MKQARTLRELFSLKGFITSSNLIGKFGDSLARIITLRRQKKQLHVLVVELFIKNSMIKKLSVLVIAMLEDIESILSMKDGALIVRNATVFEWKV